MASKMNPLAVIKCAETSRVEIKEAAENVKTAVSRMQATAGDVRNLKGGSADAFSASLEIERVSRFLTSAVLYDLEGICDDLSDALCAD